MRYCMKWCAPVRINVYSLIKRPRALYSREKMDFSDRINFQHAFIKEIKRNIKFHNKVYSITHYFGLITCIISMLK